MGRVVRDVRSTNTRATPRGVVRRRMFDSQATYRVCDQFSGLVRVEVIAAPGLRAGQRFLFTRQAVAGMEPVPVRSR
jgi:hypothetical protein